MTPRQSNAGHLRPVVPPLPFLTPVTTDPMLRSRRRFVALFIAPLLLAASGSAHQPRDLTGKWAFEVVTENGTGNPMVTLKQEGEKLTGTYESQRGGARPLEGTVKGDKVTFTVKSGVDLNFTGTVIGDTMTGTADFSGQGTATFTAKRAP
jgi:hypothetical protein